MALIYEKDSFSRVAKMLLLFSGVVVLSGCARVQPEAVIVPAAMAATEPLPTPQPIPTPLSPPVAPEKDGVNEVGRIPILMYHSVGENGNYDRHGLNIPPALFRKHLQLMYDNGLYPVNMRDVLAAHIDVPRGKIPVAITFDDARGSQFRYHKGDQIDPNCAIGILESFHKKYGAAWPQRATFFVLPKSQYNPLPFWQAGSEKKKLQFLVKNGYELANHSTSHHPLSRMDAQRLDWEMKTCKAYIQKLAPGATMDTMALPYGIYPKPQFRDVLIKAGNKCITMAWGDANYSPVDKRFDKMAVQRIGSTPGNIEMWIKALARDRKAYGKALRPYVSDGNPDMITVPASQVKWVDKNRLDGTTLEVYNEPKPATKTKEKPKKAVGETASKAPSKPH